MICLFRINAISRAPGVGRQTSRQSQSPLSRGVCSRCDDDRAFDVILVHNYSRLFRDSFGQEFYLRKLAKHGVKLIFITQPLGNDEDPAQAVMRKVFAVRAPGKLRDYRKGGFPVHCSRQERR